MKKTSDILKALEQMHRDKRSADEIHTATVRYREFAEAEEEADAQSSRKTPKKPPVVIKSDDDFGAGGVPNI